MVKSVAGLNEPKEPGSLEETISDDVEAIVKILIEDIVRSHCNGAAQHSHPSPKKTVDYYGDRCVKQNDKRHIPPGKGQVLFIRLGMHALSEVKSGVSREETVVLDLMSPVGISHESV